ncbi:MAG: hypothetical protein H3C58_10225 [Fimbriimonadaceae bacterium]|nr:hypothetical protein [Fimbriimonadaceae bacterium]
MSGSVSHDGSVIVGWTQDQSGQGRGFRWTALTGMRDLGTPGSVSYPWDVSADGSVVVGFTEVLGPRRALRWTEGLRSATSLAGGASHSLGLRIDGTVWAWGHNERGQLGVGTITDRLTPTQTLGLTGVIDVAAGRDYSIALRGDGSVWAWGSNEYGQLGDGTTTGSSTPVWTMVGLPGVAAIAAGSHHSLALRSDGSVWAWGSNEYGQLGDGTTTRRLSPVQVIGLTDAVAIAAGAGHSLAIRRDGSVWAWGNGGTLGDGTTTGRLSPVQVVGLTDAVAIAAAGHSLAVRSDGSVWAWGGNQYGQLGDGTTNVRLTPVPVVGLANATSVAAGGIHSLARLSDGTVWVWGYNVDGRLGDGTTTTQTAPVQAVWLSNATTIACGYEHSLVSRAPAVLGTATLQDISSLNRITVAVTAKLVGTDTSYGPWTVPLGPSGEFSFPAPPAGVYRITAQVPTWLSETIGPILVAPEGQEGLIFDLKNGDVNGDNTVNILDFLTLRTAFGSSSNSSNWNPRADLNRDGTVNSMDFLILRKNFGRSGT